MNKAHLTAITRKKPSLPTKYLHDKGLLVGNVLDFGCGRGFDANYYGFDAYDPHFKPAFPTKKYDTIICNYVLNVVDVETEKVILKQIKSLLKPNGKAFLTVRRDKFEEGFTSKGTYQRYVYLSNPIVKETSSFVTYLVENA